MSLIVDINPVPWEILEQVKARLLRNRAKKQKRQPEKGKDLRRVMQVDNGILAKQRWEEPSFVGGEKTPYIAFVKCQASGYELNTYNESPTVNFSFYWHKFILDRPLIQAGIVQVDLINSVNKLGDFQAISSDADIPEGYLFIWSTNADEQNDVINSSPNTAQSIDWVNAPGLGGSGRLHPDDANILSRIPIRWTIFELGGERPNPEELIYISWIISPSRHLGYFYWGFVENIKTDANVTTIFYPSDYNPQPYGVIEMDGKITHAFAPTANNIFTGVLQSINGIIKFYDD